MRSYDPRETDVRIGRLGNELWEEMQSERPSLFNREWWENQLLGRVMEDEGLKVDMFRFVDVLPTLRDTAAVSDHIREYLGTHDRELPKALTIALKAASRGLAAPLLARLIRRNATRMAERFIVGHDAAEALPALRTLHTHGIGFTVDLLGEAVVSRRESEIFRERYVELIDTLAAAVPAWPEDVVLDRDDRGRLPRVNVSVKFSAMDPHLDAVDFSGSVNRLVERMLPLMAHARDAGVFINVDLEQTSLGGMTYAAFERLARHPELAGWPHLGIVVQAYLRDADSRLNDLLDLARKRGTPLTVRLVKGAYWDYETLSARLRGWPAPVFARKAQTDSNYEHLSRRLLENHKWLRPAFGSHNLRSLAHALVVADELDVPPGALELQMLFGMAEAERRVLRERGHRVRVYCPIGELLPGMAYLVRRLLENTSNQGFLRLALHDEREIGELLAPPREVAPDEAEAGAVPAFVNCPWRDFTVEAQRTAFAEAVATTSATRCFPVVVPVIIGGVEHTERERLAWMSPNDTGVQVTSFCDATREDVDRAVQVAWEGWPSWRARTPDERAILLERVADRLEWDRERLAALQVW